MQPAARSGLDHVTNRRLEGHNCVHHRSGASNATNCNASTSSVRSTSSDRQPKVAVAVGGMVGSFFTRMSMSHFGNLSNYNESTSDVRTMLVGALGWRAHFPKHIADFYVHSWSVEFAPEIMKALEPVEARFDKQASDWYKHLLAGCKQDSASGLPQAISRVRALQLVSRKTEYDFVISTRFDVLPCQSQPVNLAAMALPANINIVVGAFIESDGAPIPKLDDAILFGRLEALQAVWDVQEANARSHMHGVHSGRGVQCNPHTRLGLALLAAVNSTERNVTYNPNPYLPFRRASVRHSFGNTPGVGAAAGNCMERTAEDCYQFYCVRHGATPGFYAGGSNVCQLNHSVTYHPTPHAMRTTTWEKCSGWDDHADVHAAI